MERWYFGNVGDDEKARREAVEDVLRALPRGEEGGTVAYKITSEGAEVACLGDVRGALHEFARKCALSVKDLTGGLAYADYLHGVEDLREDFLRCVRERMRKEQEGKQACPGLREDKGESATCAITSAFWSAVPEGFVGSYRWAAEYAVCAVMFQLMGRGEEHEDAVRQVRDQQREWLEGMLNSREEAEEEAEEGGRLG